MLHEVTNAQFEKACSQYGRRYRSRKRRERISTLLVISASLFMIGGIAKNFGAAPLLILAALIVCSALVLGNR